jgi:hypothetical protein
MSQTHTGAITDRASSKELRFLGSSPHRLAAHMGSGSLLPLSRLLACWCLGYCRQFRPKQIIQADL